MLRAMMMVLGLGLLAACTDVSDLETGKMADMGNFALGHNIVVAPKMQMGPASREATAEEWTTALTEAIDERFGRYDGGKLYHLGVSVEGYVLALPGVPLVLNPKSALIINVTVWDDAAGKKLNEEPEQLTIVESTAGESMLIGSGHAYTKEDQIKNLSQNAAKQIQNWMVQRHPEWFDIGKVKGLPVAQEPDVAAPDAPAEAKAADQTAPAVEAVAPVADAAGDETKDAAAVIVEAEAE